MDPAQPIHFPHECRNNEKSTVASSLNRHLTVILRPERGSANPGGSGETCGLYPLLFLSQEGLTNTPREDTWRRVGSYSSLPEPSFPNISKSVVFLLKISLGVLHSFCCLHLAQVKL